MTDLRSKIDAICDVSDQVHHAHGKYVNEHAKLKEFNELVLADTMRSCIDSGIVRGVHRQLNVQDSSVLKDSTDIRFVFEAKLVQKQASPTVNTETNTSTETNTNTETKTNQKRNGVETRTVRELIFSPIHMNHKEFAFHALKFFTLHPKEWPDGSEHVREALSVLMRDPGRFVLGWEAVEERVCEDEDTEENTQENMEEGTTTENVDTDSPQKIASAKERDITSEIVAHYQRACPEIGASAMVFIGNDDMTLAPASRDKCVHVHANIIRSHRDTMNAAFEMGLAPKHVLLQIDPDNIVSISVLPTTSHGHVFNLNSQVIVIPTNYTSSKIHNSVSIPDKVLCICATGIKNDRNLLYQMGSCKKISVELMNAVAHRDLGPHPIDIIGIAVPRLYLVAKNLGRIHLMTQIGKSILKSRLNHTDATLKLVGEQRGAQLKDEVKLCNYWNSIRSELSEDERDCLYKGMNNMKTSGVPSISYKNGSMDSHVSKIHPSAETRNNNNQSNHHVQAVFNIRGGVTVPCRSLNRGMDSLKVHVDNDWDLECNILSYC
jgi:hypothetical protein